MLINLGIISDLLLEGNEQFQISISHVANSPLIPISGSGTVITTIIDNGLGTSGLYAHWEINGTSQANEGQNVTYTVGLDGILNSGQAASINLIFTDLTTDGLDHGSFNDAVVAAVLAYNQHGPGTLDWTNGVLTFTSSGQAMGNFQIILNTINDELVEGPEQFNLSFNNPMSTTGAVITGSGSIDTTLIDSGVTPPELDTANWSLAGSADVNEGGAATYTVSLAGTLQAGETASVQLNIINLNASSEDYASFDAAVLAAVDAYNSTGNGSLSWVNGVLTVNPWGT